MEAGLVDADILTERSKFPNLALMKISGNLKENGIDSNLIFWWNAIPKDKLHTEEYILDAYKACHSVYISKVFTDPPLDKRYLVNPYKNVFFGGTGFGYEGNANRLPEQVEKDQFPDYDLYTDYVQWKYFDKHYKRSDYQYYLDWSIGFLTRGCFRHCQFCVNRDSEGVRKCSDPKTFVDQKRKYICLLDDNFLGYSKWEQELDNLESYNKPFQFKQGLDFRLMKVHSMKKFINTNWKGDYIFAFDNIQDSQIIQKNLALWRSFTDKRTKFYIFTGFYPDRGIQDIYNLCNRITIVMEYNCLPFVMKHENYKKSKFRQLYVDIARWANQPQFFKRMSFREFCEADNIKIKTACRLCASLRAYKDVTKEYPELKTFFERKYTIT